MRALLVLGMLVAAAAASRFTGAGDTALLGAADGGTTAVVSADDGAALADLTEVVAAIRSSRMVTLSAYTLSPRSRVTRALVAAATAGRSIHLVLTGTGMAGAVRDNQALAESLCAATGGTPARARTDARLVPICTGALRIDLTRFPLHMKAVVADGAVYVSDRNWTASRRSLILRVPASARITVERAILGSPSTAGALTTRKADSLASEAALLSRQRSHVVLLESESFGRGPIATHLGARARAGDDVTLVVARMEYERNDAERALVAELVAAGVHAYVATSDEKIAVDGDAAWLGSSNATAGVPDQVDWGFTAINATLARTLAQHVRDDAAAGERVR